MYSDNAPCSVCGSAVRLRPHPGVRGDEAPSAGDGPAGPEGGVVGAGDDPVDLRECSNPDCASHAEDGPDA